MKQVTVIVPLHIYDEINLTDSLNSFIETFTEDFAVLSFVGPKDVCENAVKLFNKLTNKKYKVTLIENEDTEFNKQINIAVLKCATPYFSILEFDDAYTEHYQKVMEKYIQLHPETSVILSINQFFNIKGDFIGFCNEIAWDASFIKKNENTREEELGYITYDELNDFMDFNCTGGLFKTEDFISAGCLKSSMKIASWYEFLLRITNLGKKVFVLPKVIYSHLIGREGSYGELMHKGLSNEEGKFLIDYAKTDYVNLSDSNLKYKD